MSKMQEYTGKKVTLLCTSECNIKCEHCYVSYSGRRDPNELFDIVKKLKNKYKIMLNGAEVLTNLEYLKSYKEINQHWILSNGMLLLNDEVINALVINNIKSVSMSYHFNIHDNISKIKLEILNQVFEKLKEKGLEYRLLTTITTQNYQLIDIMCEQAYNMGAKGIMFTNFIKQGRGINLDKSLILTQSQLDVFFEKIRLVRNKYNKNEFIIERSGTFGKSCYNNNFQCEYGNNRVYITPNNKVYPCIFMTKPGYEIGEYIDDKIMLYESFKHNGEICIVKEYCNNNKALSKLLKK